MSDGTIPSVFSHLMEWCVVSWILQLSVSRDQSFVVSNKGGSSNSRNWRDQLQMSEMTLFRKAEEHFSEGSFVQKPKKGYKNIVKTFSCSLVNSAREHLLENLSGKFIWKIIVTVFIQTSSWLIGVSQWPIWRSSFIFAIDKIRLLNNSKKNIFLFIY